MTRGTAASNAFDMMRRRQILEQRQRQADTGGETKEEGSAAESEAVRTTAAAPERVHAPKAAAAELGPEFRNVGRNDTCPCGSGKKFKKCHGK